MRKSLVPFARESQKVLFFIEKVMRKSQLVRCHDVIPSIISRGDIRQLRWLPIKGLNDLMELKGGKTKSCSNKSFLYEAPLDYIIEDVRPHGGIKKFRSAAYSNCIRKPS
ncbi:unnamed protein product [Sphenostylis stenocarpa]|uniref:Uncharacterized protein n=1 Tax=Sphenostylis stenocarpa TaxID=92480 RepID=A0AA86SB67_9FABA|nr:unnamed protein product [Sphenostylis stenocarpa]